MSWHERISHRTVRASLEKQFDPKGPIASRGEFLPAFLRKPLIATCDFSRGSGPPANPTPTPVWSQYESTQV